MTRTLYMDVWGDLVVYLMGGTDDVSVRSQELDLYYQELEKSIIWRSRGTYGALFGLVGSVASDRVDSVVSMKVTGRILRKYEDELRRSTKAFAMVSPSLIGRVGTRLVFSFAPPPYLWSIVSDVEQAAVYLSAQGVQWPAASVVEKYKEAASRF